LFYPSIGPATTQAPIGKTLGVFPSTEGTKIDKISELDNAQSQIRLERQATVFVDVKVVEIPTELRRAPTNHDLKYKH